MKMHPVSSADRVQILADDPERPAGTGSFAGLIQNINIEKRERLLGGRSVWYSNDEAIPDDLEKAFTAISEKQWEQFSREEFVHDLARLFPRVWQVHPFREGNTRTVVMMMTLFVEHYSTLAESADIAPSTAKEWLKVLVGLYIVYLLAPFSNNELKRLSKTPKLYFCDTGLCAYLSMWLTPDTLRNGAASGHYYENYVVMELVKNYAYARSKVNITYFRDSNAKEIDVFVEENNVIHPLEIKKSAMPDRREVKKYSVIDKASLNRGNGGIICMCEEPIPIDAENCFIPSNLI